MRGGELAEGATEERVKALIRNVQRGGGQNGVGHGQLITISLVKEAERLGEAHIPWFQMRVAFRYLNDLIAAYGWRGERIQRRPRQPLPRLEHLRVGHGAPGARVATEAGGRRPRTEGGRRPA